MMFGQPLLILAAATDDNVAAIEISGSDRGCAFCSLSKGDLFFF